MKLMKWTSGNYFIYCGRLNVRTWWNFPVHAVVCKIFEYNDEALRGAKSEVYTSSNCDVTPPAPCIWQEVLLILLLTSHFVIHPFVTPKISPETRPNILYNCREENTHHIRLRLHTVGRESPFTLSAEQILLPLPFCHVITFFVLRFFVLEDILM